MNIEINTDKTNNGDEKHQDKLIVQISKELNNYNSHITDIAVHLSDHNGHKKGWNYILCLLKAKFDDKDPIVVSNQAITTEIAMAGAIDKLMASIESTLGQLQFYYQKN
jgi:hypothetical protein